MTDVPITAASAALATGAGAALSGLPTQEVMAWAVIGGLASVWLAQKAAGSAFGWRWITTAVAQVVVSAAAGVAISALILAVAPAYGATQPLAAVPQWVLAGIVAAVIHRMAPLLWERLERMVKGGAKEGDHVQ